MQWKLLTTVIVAFSATQLMAQDQSSRDSSNRHQRSQNDHQNMKKSPEEMKKILDQESVSLTDAIRTAERTTQGKAISAEVATWKCFRGDSAMSDNNQATDDRTSGDEKSRDANNDDKSDSSSSKTTSSKKMNLQPDHPIIRVVCLANNQMMETIICGKNGDVLDKRECTKDSGRYASSGDSSNTSSGYRGESWFRPASRWQKTSDLIGKNLTDATTNEKIGEIKELVVDPDSGRILYLAVEFDNKMGQGTRWYPIPVSAVHMTDDYKAMGIKYSAAQISKTNGFDPKSSWPNMADAKWGSDVYKTFNQTAYWEQNNNEKGKVVRTASDTDAKSNRNDMQPAPKRWQKATDLMGKKVFNRQNEELGKLEEITVDPDSGRILYGVLSFGGFLGMGDKFFAIPWGALELTPDYDHLVFDISKEHLKTAEGFDKKNWPNMADQRWASQVHDYYGRPKYWERSN